MLQERPLMADQEYGVHVRYESENPVVDIVAVHGLNSGASRAWRHAASGKVWIADPAFLEKLAHPVRTMTFGYNANAFTDIVTSRIVDHASKLLEDLYHQRRSCLDRPLIFVAHSAGGLVTKKALLRAREDETGRYSAITSSTAGIIFMGTPHNGAANTGLLKTLERLAAWSKLRSPASTNFTGELRTFSNTVEDINRSFRGGNLEIVDFYERKPTNLGFKSKLIVEPASAMMSKTYGREIPCACTHSEISKFESPLDVRFKDFANQLHEMIENALAKQKLSTEHHLLSAAEHVSPESSELKHQLPVTKRWIWPNNQLTELDESSISRSPMNKPYLSGLTVETDKEEDTGQQEFFRALADRCKSFSHPLDRLDRHQGTCKWIIEHPVFANWCNSDEDSLMFVQGPSGHGKSVIANYLVTQLRQEQRLVEQHADVFGLFCKQRGGKMLEERQAFGESSDIRVDAPVLESIAYRTFQRHKHVPQFPSDQVDLRTDNGIPSRPTLLEVVKRTRVHGVRPMVMIVDGLDECCESYIVNLLTDLSHLISPQPASSVRASCPTYLKILITCQPRSPIPRWSNLYPAINLPCQGNKADVAHYIEDEVASIADVRHFTSALRGEVRRTLLLNANGMFLWAFYILQELRHMREVSPILVRKAITTFPGELHPYYMRSLERIVAHHRGASVITGSDPAKVFQFIYFSQFHVSPSSLAEALALSEDTLRFSDLEDSINFDIETSLRTTFAPFIRIEEDQVDFAHSSMREFFQSLPPDQQTSASLFAIDGRAGHLMMVQLCLRYLLLRDFEDMPLEMFDNHQRRLSLYSKYHFLRYAVLSLGHHIKQAQEKIRHIAPLLKEFFDESHRNYQTWAHLATRGSHPPHRKRVMPVLHYIASHELTNLLEVLFPEIAPVSSDSWFATTSMWKTVNSVVASIRQVQHASPQAADFEKLDWANLTAVDRAAYTSHVDVLRAMLEAGAPPSGHQNQALNLAARKGSTDCIGVLLKYGCQVDASDHKGLTPLMNAAWAGKHKAVQALIEAGADCNRCRPGGSGCASLIIAMQARCQISIRHLIAGGANITFIDSTHQTALHYCARRHLPKLAALVLANCDTSYVNAREENGCTALQCAADSGCHEVVRLLLDHGAHIDGYENESDLTTPTGKNFATPLYRAVASRHPTIAILLLERGACWAQLSQSTYSVLHQAVVRKQTEVLRKLFQLGADVNMKDSQGCSLLRRAICQDDPNLVRLVLSQEPRMDDHTQGPKVTDLHRAAWQGNLEMVDALLKAGADACLVDEWGGTPAMAAALQNNVECLKLLLKHSGSHDLTYRSGRPVLFYAVDQCAEECVDILLKHNGKTCSERWEGWQPLHMAAAKGYLSLAKRLIQAGGDPNTKDYLHMTPLMLAVYKGKLGVAKFFIEAGATLKTENTEGRNMCHFAALSGNLEMVQYILDRTSAEEINALSAGWFTPLHCACIAEDPQIFKVFLQHGADPLVCGKSGFSTLHIAIDRPNPNLYNVRSVINMGHFVSDVAVNGLCPLDIACHRGHVQIARELILAGADPIRAGGRTGKTCLHRAADYDHPDVVTMLMGTCPNLNVDLLSLGGFTPLILAVVGEHWGTARTLIELGADIRKRDCFGRTAYDYFESLRILRGHVMVDLNNQTIALSNSQDLSSACDVITQAKDEFGFWSNDWRLMGRVLHHCGDTANAIIAVQCALVLPPLLENGAVLEKKLYHFGLGRRCDHCNEAGGIQGTLFMCAFCPDIDSCEVCYKGRRANGMPALICGHDPALKVPGMITDLDLRIAEPEKWEAKMRKWLADLKAKYAGIQRELPDDRDGDLRYVYDESVSFRSTWFLRLAGLRCLGRSFNGVLRGNPSCMHKSESILWGSLIHDRID